MEELLSTIELLKNQDKSVVEEVGLLTLVRSAIDQQISRLSISAQREVLKVKIKSDLARYSSTIGQSEQLAECQAELLQEINPEPQPKPDPDPEPEQQSIAIATPIPSERMQQKISVLKLARGWEEKLIAAGVITVQDLGSWIASNKLIPGALNRVGPEAIEKIKSAWREYIYPAGVSESDAAKNRQHTTPSIPPTGMSPIPKQSDEDITAEGAQFAKLGYKACENPHKPGTHAYTLWDSGWQEHFATHEANDEATVERSAIEPDEEPDEQSDFPELVLAGSNQSPQSDDEFADL